MNIAKYIDHTALKADTSKEAIQKLIDEAKQYGFKSVCVNPGYVSFASEQLKDTGVEVCTVIGFPLGASTTETKVFETKDAIEKGATEIDMVINVSQLKDKEDAAVEFEISEIVKAAKGKAIVKVIIETSLLTDEEKERACLLAKKANADFVKTSTGFSTGGATVEDIKLMRSVVGEDMGVKASGGIRTIEDVNSMIEAGATRIGASAGVSIMKGENNIVDNY
ncbi:deoxyribose-phosphate aldolase [Bacillus pakistanensis]|uniref:Deoxyribose-phosphate aldolase n=1 Tax=Rossellomorea pakistanensis TaxID=992288 RepID=A0ABS2NCP6_9BACI|nr:deoxyribose-phosphate aldolase [Bacillus pakistanensis]MBM7585632.1 deoxyribose-phosphate aldolase [Bacillus pakistanensis]